ncbi:MAG: hypothetical protein WAT92_00175 [Saprospiraceae bacterium]
MKHILILSFILILSCTKEDTSCRNYNLVIESSENSARQKCNGLANSHPEFKTIESKLIGCLTNDKLKEAKKSESTTTKIYCDGVSFQIKVSIK